MNPLHLTRRTLLAGAGSLAAAQTVHRPAQAAAPLRIGILSDMSTAYADLGGPGSVEAARLAVEDFGGSVLGRPIEILSADHQNKADIGLGIINRWYDVDGVSAVFDVMNSAIGIAAQGVTRDKGKLIFFTTAASSDLSGKYCSTNGFSWGQDTYSMTKVVALYNAAQGRTTWFLILADYAGGHSQRVDLTKSVDALGGKVLGAAVFPLNNSEFSSQIVQAQSSGAQCIAFLGGGSDMVSCVKQMAEFGVMQGGKQAVALPATYLTDMHSMGLEASQGIVTSFPYYWDRDDACRSFNRRFVERMAGKRYSHHGDALNYSAVTHYLKAVQAAQTDECNAVRAAVTSIPVNDFFTRQAAVRADGKVMRDMLVLQVKRPGESKGPWDCFDVLDSLAGEKVFRPVADSECALLKA